MKYERGDVVLVSFPFTDFSKHKVRPALIVSFSDIYPKDVVITAISSKATQILENTWILIEDTAPHFYKTGLKLRSIIKVEKIALIDPFIIQRKIGELPEEMMKKVNGILCKIWHCSEGFNNQL